MPTKICYFAHDLADPAIHRRVRMLIQGGANVTTIGFRRSAEPVTVIHGTPVIDLGRTVDGMLAKRALTVAQAFSKLKVLAEHLRGADVVLCRNLEMLVLASRARSLYAPQAALVYECLDIHHLLLSDGAPGAALRALETRLWRNVGLLLTSSPAFIENYFRRRNFGAPIRLVENKVLGFEDEYAPVGERKRPSGPPWRIGWFGMIRCRRSLDILSSIARAADGAIEVAIRGQPSRAVFPTSMRNWPTVPTSATPVPIATQMTSPGSMAKSILLGRSTTTRAGRILPGCYQTEFMRDAAMVPSRWRLTRWRRAGGLHAAV